MKHMGEIIDKITELEKARYYAEEHQEWASYHIINDKIELLKWVLD